MHFLLLLFGLLFVSAELLQWMEGIFPSFHMFFIGGILLAIASNYTKQLGLPWIQRILPKNLPTPSAVGNTTQVAPATSRDAGAEQTSSPAPQREASNRPVSFLIRRPPTAGKG